MQGGKRAKAVPKNQTLYAKVKKEADKKFERPTSAYKSMWIQREYKKRGGKYTAGKRGNNLSRWRREIWVQVIPYLRDKAAKLACGEGKHTKACRPLVRVDSRTPPTLPELLKLHGKKKLLALAQKKSSNMSRRVNWKAGTISGGGGTRSVRVTDPMGGKRSYVLEAPQGKKFHPDFRPKYTPKQMLSMGVFEGRYLNNISREFPSSWFANAKLSTGRADPALNYFGVKSRSSLQTWRKNGWINQKHDPRGWFQWYCRYWMGRRIPEEDERQIKRWKSFGARHQGQIRASYTRGADKPRTRAEFKKSRPRQRQGLLQWSHDPFV